MVCRSFLTVENKSVFFIEISFISFGLLLFDTGINLLMIKFILIPKYKNFQSDMVYSLYNTISTRIDIYLLIAFSIL